MLNAAMFLAMAALLLVGQNGQGPEKTSTFKRIVLTAPDGTARIELGTFEAGTPEERYGLRILDSEKTPRVELALLGGGTSPQLLLGKADGDHNRSVIRAGHLSLRFEGRVLSFDYQFPQGAVGLTLHDSVSKSEITQCLKKDGYPHIRVRGIGEELLMIDPPLGSRISSFVNPMAPNEEGVGIESNDGNPSLNLRDSSHILRARVEVGADGSTGLSLYDSNGRKRCWLGVGGDGTPFLLLLDEQGRTVKSKG